jgi:hypothetical protein
VAAAGDVMLHVPCCEAHREGHHGMGGRPQAQPLQ